MQIPEKAWNDYVTRLSRLNQKAGQLMQQYIEQHGTQDVDALIRHAYALVTKYGEGSAELACQMYDALAEAQGATVPQAEPAQPASYGEVARMVHSTQQSPPQMQNGVSRLVKRAGADTTLQNAQRDGAQFAWVPHGDTCPFCIALASRGWQRISKTALKKGHAEHIHANCDCEYAVRFDSGTGVAGYDPDEYLRQYGAANGDLNAMRRERYAQNKEHINAQKRAAYAARKANAANGDTVHKYLGTVDLSDTEQVENLKNTFCEQYASSSVENMMVITKDGEVHFMTDNNPTGVDCSYLGDKLKGSYNIHTHPPDTTQYSFSTDADIPAAFSDGTAVMEAVDYKYRYRFVVPREITFKEWDTTRDEVQDTLAEVMIGRGFDLDDYEENRQHVLIDETCKRLGLRCYSRKDRK